MLILWHIVDFSTPLQLRLQLILHQSSTFSAEGSFAQYEAKCHFVSDHRQCISDLLLPSLSLSLQRSVLLSEESDSSSWLTALPLSEHGFALHKGAFRDALYLRYGWILPLLSSSCICGEKCTVEHVLSCPSGGLPTIRHNELRDLTAGFLSEVCYNVGVEPSLQPVTGEQFSYISANVEDGSQVDVVAEGFWNWRQKAYFDVKFLILLHQPIVPPHCHNGIGDRNLRKKDV